MEIDVHPITYVMSLPRKGYLSVVLQMFSFLNSKHNDVTLFDHTATGIYLTQFLTEVWSENSYGPCEEDVTSNDPAPRGM